MLLLVALLGCAASAARADTGDPLRYYGGPVAHSMTGVVVDWGTHVNPMYTNPTTGDPGLIKSFAAASGSPSVIGGVLAQYMDTSGANAANQVSYGGQFQIAPTTSATTLQDSDVAAQLVTQISAGVIPAPAGDGLSTAYLVNFPAGTTVCEAEGCSGQALCSYHSSTYLPDGRHVLYVVLPDNTSGAMTQGCGIEATPLRDQTSYLSHEWAETINDPLVTEVTTAGPPLAWYDPVCPSDQSMCGEIADKCNQETTVQGGFTVQLLWSDIDGACLGGEPRYATPQLSVTAPATAVPGLPSAFSATATASPGNAAAVSYAGRSYSIAPGIAVVTWNWGDGSSPTTGASARHTFAHPGVYTVSATAVDTLGFASTATRTVAAWGPLGPPRATTGAASAIRATSVVLSGKVNAVGLLVGSRFEYGTNPSALSSSTPLHGGLLGTAAHTVSAPVAGLRPSTTYYDRLDVVVGGISLPGPVQSFRTLAATAHRASAKGRKRHRATRRHRTVRRRHAIRLAAARAVPVRARVVGRAALGAELRDGLLVQVGCPAGQPCRAHLMATLRLTGPAAAAVVPRALAAVSVALPHGAGRVRLHFSPSARRWLAHRRGAQFAVSGYAD